MACIEQKLGDIEVQIHNEVSCILEQEQRVIFDPLPKAAAKKQQVVGNSSISCRTLFSRPRHSDQI